MYLDHFGLKEPPFRITPHTDFFFDGADRGTTLEALVYAILHDEGIIKVSGEVGSGKTMLCRVLMERLPQQVATIYVATPSLGRDEILYTIADELNLQFSQGRVTIALRELQDQLIRLYGEGRRVVILIDEAHAMPEETLEQVRLLSNLESNRHKLLQIVLFGQPELDQALAKPSLRQLKDRITHSFRMRALTLAEVGTYLTFRMRAAGYRGPDVFMPAAVARIARAADGLSRRINILADKSLLAAFAENTHAVGMRQVRKAINDSEFAPISKARRPVLIGAVALAAGLLLGALVPWFGTFPSLVDPYEAGPQNSAKANQPAAVNPAVVQAPAQAPVATVTAPAPAPAPSEPAAAPVPVGAITAPVPIVQAPAPAAVPLTVTQATAAQPVPQPAQQKVVAATAAAPEPGMLGAEQVQRISGYSSGNSRLLKERLSATRSLLEKEPDAAYSIELFVTDNGDAARMERFLVRARELVPLSEVYVVPTATGGRYRIRVLFGRFSDRDAAADAQKRLPPRYQKAFQTVPRSFAELRAAI